MSRAAALAVAAMLALGGCTGDGSEPAPPAQDAASDDEPGAEVPQECIDAMIPTLGGADLEDVAMLPSGWPDPPSGSVLCVTKETAGGGQEVAEYATPLAPDAVLDDYAAALADLGVGRDEDGLGGEVLTGTVDGVGYQITAREGAFTLTFATG